MLSQTTLEIIHREYQLAVAEATDLVQIPTNLYQNLKNHEDEILQKDSDIFFRFLDALLDCSCERQFSSKFISLIQGDFLKTMECIAQFLDLNIGWYFREKKIYSDLTKILNKSLSAKGSVLIRDRFGIRGILDDSTDNDNIEKLYVIHKTISNIISTKESKIRDNFIKWYTNHNMDSSKSIDTVLSIPFKMDEKSVKDYLIKPKDNGYRSLHFGLIIADYSQVFPGVHLEIQLRDLHMHEAATQGGAACWNKYKSEIPLEIREVFQLDSNTNLQLPDEDVESLFAKPLNLQ